MYKTFSVSTLGITKHCVVTTVCNAREAGENQRCKGQPACESARDWNRKRTTRYKSKGKGRDIWSWRERCNRSTMKLLRGTVTRNRKTPRKTWRCLWTKLTIICWRLSTWIGAKWPKQITTCGSIVRMQSSKTERESKCCRKSYSPSRSRLWSSRKSNVFILTASS